MATEIEEIQKLGAEMKSRLDQAEGQSKESGKLSADLKAEMSGIAAQQAEMLKSFEKQQGDIDGLATAAKRLPAVFEGATGGVKSLYSLFAEKLHKAQAAEGGILAAIKGGGITVDAESNFKGEKAVGDMNIGTNVTGNLFIAPQVLPGVQAPQIEEHIRAYMTVGSTNSNLVRYLQMLRKEGAFGMVAEAALKPELDYSFALVDAPVRKIAGHIRISDEMLDDIPFVATMLSTIAIEDLKLKEDEQVLYGTGTGQNLKGVALFASPFAPGTFRVTAPNLWDILVAIRLQIRKLKYRATAAFVSPTVYAALRVAKDTQNAYLFPSLQTNPNGTFTVDGVTVVENVAMADGDIIMGNFTTGAILLDRKQALIKSSDSDRDNFIANMVTFVIEERVALAVTQPLSFVKTTVDLAKAALIAA